MLEIFKTKNKVRLSFRTGKQEKIVASFFDLKSSEQKKILSAAVREANKDQLALVKKSKKY